MLTCPERCSAARLERAGDREGGSSRAQLRVLSCVDSHFPPLPFSAAAPAGPQPPRSPSRGGGTAPPLMTLPLAPGNPAGFITITPALEGVGPFPTSTYVFLHVPPSPPARVSSPPRRMLIYMLCSLFALAPADTSPLVPLTATRIFGNPDGCGKMITHPSPALFSSSPRGMYVVLSPPATAPPPLQPHAAPAHIPTRVCADSLRSSYPGARSPVSSRSSYPGTRSNRALQARSTSSATRSTSRSLCKTSLTSTPTQP